MAPLLPPQEPLAAQSRGAYTRAHTQSCPTPQSHQLGHMLSGFHVEQEQEVMYIIWEVQIPIQCPSVIPPPTHGASPSVGNTGLHCRRILSPSSFFAPSSSSNQLPKARILIMKVFHSFPQSPLFLLLLNGPNKPGLLYHTLTFKTK